MPHPFGVAYAFAAAMVTVSLYCVGRLVAARKWHRQNHVAVNIAHITMGAAMAGMLVPQLNPVPNVLWEVVFGAIGAWFARESLVTVLSRRRPQPHVADSHGHHVSHYLIHLVMALAMLYMYLAVSPSPTLAGSSPMSMAAPTGVVADFVGLPLLFAAVLFGSAVWQIDALGKFAPVLTGAVGADGPVQAPPAAGPAPRPSGHIDLSAGERPWLAPRLEMGCHIAMCVTMGYMLVLML